MAVSNPGQADRPTCLPQWLLWQARHQPRGVALRHKRLGIWQVRSWQQAAEEMLGLAAGLQARGFTAEDSLLLLSRPRPEALLLTLAAQWLGGVATLLDPLDEHATQVAGLRLVAPHFVFAEGPDELQRLQTAELAPVLLLYADERVRLGNGVPALAYDRLLGVSQGLARPASVANREALVFYRSAAAGGLESQRIEHADLLREGRRLVRAERLGNREEALAARAFAAGGQARYLLAPWLIAGFRLNFPESLATRDSDRRALGPTLVLGTRETYGRLYARVQQRLPAVGSWRRRWLEAALVAQPRGLAGGFGHLLFRRPLRDLLGLSRTRVPLLVGEPLDEPVRAFFSALGIEVRTWPEADRWQASAPTAPTARVAPPPWVDSLARPGWKEHAHV
ncbi:MAG: AMP-binding protein [Pseudomonas sp.]|uniref:AMP-binding protein n=1 Tax=Pseudomonas sp. TaxID=306 RepID=UPI003393C9B2